LVAFGSCPRWQCPGASTSTLPLSRSLTPLSSTYELDINPEKDMTESNPYIFTSFIFAVKSKITLTTTFASKYLFLHAADIRATAAAMKGAAVQLADIVYATDLELSIVVLSDILVDNPPLPPPQRPFLLIL
jgi:hypothetical protein